MKDAAWLACERLGPMAAALRTCSVRKLCRGDSGMRLRRLACCAVARLRVREASRHFSDGGWEGLNESTRALDAVEAYALAAGQERAAMKAAMRDRYADVSRRIDRHAGLFHLLPGQPQGGPAAEALAGQALAAWRATLAAMEGAYVAGSRRASLSRLCRATEDAPAASCVREVYYRPFGLRGEPALAPDASAKAAARSLAWAAAREARCGVLDGARLLVLSDFLEEAGCGAHPAVAHLREPGIHPVGCWAVFSLLGFREGP
jgi:hypothetical protein